MTRQKMPKQRDNCHACGFREKTLYGMSAHTRCLKRVADMETKAREKVE